MLSGAAPRYDQAKSRLNQGSFTDMLGAVCLPRSVKEAGSKAVAGFNKLSTTQKVVSGALLALGVRYLTRGSGKATGREAQADTLNDCCTSSTTVSRTIKRPLKKARTPNCAPIISN